MPSVRFVPNPVFQAQLFASPQCRAAVRAHAEVARGFAQTFANQLTPGGAIIPRRGVPRGRTIVVEETELGSAVVNTDHGAAIVEWGSRNSPPVAPLRRGVQAAGLTLRGDEGR